MRVSPLQISDLETIGFRIVDPDDVVLDDSRQRLASGLQENCCLKLWFDRYCLPNKLAGKKGKRWSESLQETVVWWHRLMGSIPLRLIDDADVARFRATLEDQPGRRKGQKLATMTVRSRLKQLHYLFTLANKRVNHCGEIVQMMPYLPEFDFPAKPVRDAMGYTPDEVRRLLAAINAFPSLRFPRLQGVRSPDWWRSLVEFLYYEGCRIGETLRLEYRHLEGDVLTIPDEIAKMKRGCRIKLQPESLAALQRIRTDHPTRSFIFQLHVGNSLRPEKQRADTLHHLFDRILHSAGLKQVGRSFHGFRRTNASELTMRVSKDAAAMSLRHSDTRVTEDYLTGEARMAEDFRNKQSLPRLSQDAGALARESFNHMVAKCQQLPEEQLDQLLAMLLESKDKRALDVK